MVRVQELAAALAHFEQARALVNVARADFFPQISAAPTPTSAAVPFNPAVEECGPLRVRSPSCQ